MAVNLLPVVNSGPFIDSSGNPLSGGKLYFYTAGSSTPQDTYTTSAGSVANANPVILDSGGYPATGGSVVEVWGTSGVSYKIILKTSADVTVWTRDNLSGINDVSSTSDQWETGPAPTYIGATSFSLVGDQTTNFHVGRRVKTTNSGGTIYSTITVSAYTSLTTVTVVNDSGTLDSGLSAVSYGLLTATNPSTPLLTDAFPVVSGSADKTKKLRIEVDGFTIATTRILTPPDADLTLAAITAAGDTWEASASGVFVKRTATATVAAHATTSDPWDAHIVTLSGSAVTFTDLADADYVGQSVLLIMNAAHIFTDGAVFDVQGGATYTTASGDQVLLVATAVDAFDVTIFPANGGLTGIKGRLPITLGTRQATTSGTSWDFTIPAGVKRIECNYVGHSTSGTSVKLIQVGGAGGLVVTTYLGSGWELDGSPTGANFTTGFGINSTAAADVLHGTIVLRLEDAATFTWVASGTLAASNGSQMFYTAGSVSLSEELTTVRVTTVNGTDAGDAGSVNVSYE